MDHWAGTFRGQNSGLSRADSGTAWRDIRSPLTVADLRAMLVAPSRGVIAFPSRPYDEVYPGIIIGDCSTALCLPLLRSLHVTHVLNAALGRGGGAVSLRGHVATSAGYYSELGVQFLGLSALDVRGFDISVHFDKAAEFIAGALRDDDRAVWMATDPVILESLRVSAVLNAAQGIGQSHLVDTDSYFYERRRLPVKFLGLHAIDADWYRLEDWFQVAADFIHESRRSGKVLVHCVQGLSRSATLVIAYLMIKLHMSLSQALQTVRARREIFPNDGFLQQLIRLNNQLMDARRVNVSWL
ncbi:Dual specificity protein phosphatase 3 [Amphibalanus amphitrite]|uniref:protein-serine/threonine phosphatase n=1 Tax=Amphibalanus amphitrite TaxID=1232801 RepID=A0A6A4W1B0_AMPAM|nr:Dual specificity protein phosphatase 3 [Amphibalanus amphitrite]